MGLQRHPRVTTWVRLHASIKKTGTKAAPMIPVFSGTFNRAPHATTIVQLETVFNPRLLEGAYR